MDAKTRINNEIDLLTNAIDATPDDFRPYLDRGKLYYRLNNFPAALNDFNHVRMLAPTLVEAEEYVKMIYEILEFRYTDIYNP